METQRELVERWIGELRVVVCGRCRGLGEIGLPSLRAACPNCGGCGETTTTVPPTPAQGWA